jgi:hypothetical protein
MRTLRLPGRTVAVAAAAVALVAGGGVAYAAVTVCPTQSNPSHAQLEQYMKCRLDAIEVKVDALAKPPVTTTATVTASPVTSTVTQTVIVTATPSTSTSTTVATTLPTTATSTTTTPPANWWPDSSNTGAKGTLTKQTGDVTITTNGTTLADVEIAGQVTVRADNVTLRNVKVNSLAYWGVYNYGLNLTIVDSTLIAGAGSQASLAGDNITATRVDIYGAGDGAKLGSNSTLVDSYIHDLGGAAQGAHNDGIELTGALNTRVEHNSILNQNSQTSALMLSEYYGTGTANVVVKNNLLGGGGFTLYGGLEAGKTLRTGISVTGNQFTTRFFPQSGYYGPVAYWDSRNTWSGNIWGDGPNAGQPVS